MFFNYARSRPAAEPASICLPLSELEAAQLLGLLRQQMICLQPATVIRSPWWRLAERIVQMTVMADQGPG